MLSKCGRRRAVRKRQAASSRACPLGLGRERATAKQQHMASPRATKAAADVQEQQYADMRAKRAALATTGAGTGVGSTGVSVCATLSSAHAAVDRCARRRRPRQRARRRTSWSLTSPQRVRRISRPPTCYASCTSGSDMAVWACSALAGSAAVQSRQAQGTSSQHTCPSGRRAFRRLVRPATAELCTPKRMQATRCEHALKDAAHLETWRAQPVQLQKCRGSSAGDRAAA